LTAALLLLPELCRVSNSWSVVRHTMKQRLRIIVTGLIAQHPTLGGVAWDYLQYVLGLAELGHDVFYFEDSGEWPYNFDGGPTGNDLTARDPTDTVRPLAKIFERYGLSDRWAYRFPVQPQWFGLSDQKRKDVLQTADLLINVSGTIDHPDQYESVPRMLYIDSDPAFTQVKLALQQELFCERVNAHDVHFTFGEGPFSAVPATGHHWRPTRQPIVLSEWSEVEKPRDVFSTVMSWTSYKPLAFDGRTYSQKDVEFRKFLELPERVGAGKLEIAMGGRRHAIWESEEKSLPRRAASLVGLHPDWTPRDLLEHMGWRVADALRVCGDLDSYRNYIQSSKAEWSVAKNGYVRDRTGWFSCRSACYLAAGRPVVVQDTGFSDVLPVGEGLLAFNTLNEAAEAIRSVELDYARHAGAARAIAEEYFDARKVLARLIDDATGST
jgi:hypothetical protein